MDQLTPLCPNQVIEALQNHLQVFQKYNHNAHTLLLGPSGSGKTTIVEKTIRHVGIQMFYLDAIRIAQSFPQHITRAISKAKKSTPSVIFIDNIDFCTSQSGNISDFLLISILDDLMATTTASGGILVIGTACEAKHVHQSLIRCGRFENLLEVDGLNFHERQQHTQKWLSAFVPTVPITDHEAMAATVAAATPGFLFSDLIHLFSQLENSTTKLKDDQLKHTSNRFHVIQNNIPKVLDNVRLGLLKTTKSTSEKNATSSVETPLIGMDKAIKQLEDCLVATFRSKITNIESPQFQAKTALDRIGDVSGVIIHGPTGCGKSALLKLAQSLLPAHTVNFLPIDTASILSSVIGDSERHLSSLFRTARAISPTVILIENIELLAPCREQDSGDGGGSSSFSFSRILSTLLIEIDGITKKTSNKPILVLATTPSVESVDPALLRPGRFDTRIGVSLPNSETRWQILNACIEARGMKLNTLENYHSYNSKDAFIKKSVGWTCADVIAEGLRILYECMRKNATDELPCT